MLISKKAHLFYPDQVAEKIIKAIKKKKFAISIGIEGNLLLYFHSILNGLLNKIFWRSIKKNNNRKVLDK